MVVYLCLLIPVLTVIILYFFYAHKTEWWEFLVPLAVSFIFIIIGKYAAISSLTLDTQYLGGYVTETRYYERWDEFIKKSCPYSCGTKKNPRTCYRDCSYVQNHPEYWTAETTFGSYEITKKRHNELLGLFKIEKPTFKELNRNYHTIDGDMYFGKWGMDDETLVPFTIKNMYENRPKASQSIYRYQEVDSFDIATYKPFDYPIVDNKYQQVCIMGYNDPIAEKKLQVLNARLGDPKHVRVFIIVFKNQPIEAGHIQERLWEGSNKNEFVITIGIDDNHAVKWVHDFSWTEVEETKVETKDFLMSQKSLDLSALVDFTYQEINSKWIPRNFHEFDVLTIQPSMRAILIIFILTIAINVGMGIWIVKNDFDESTPAEIRDWMRSYLRKR